jgi:hypothetical protein
MIILLLREIVSSLSSITISGPVKLRSEKPGFFPLMFPGNNIFRWYTNKIDVINRSFFKKRSKHYARVVLHRSAVRATLILEVFMLAEILVRSGSLISFKSLLSLRRFGREVLSETL